MKKFLILFTITAALAAAVCMIAGCTTADSPPNAPDKTPQVFTVSFVRENQTVLTRQTEYGKPVEKPEGLPDESFIVWYLNGAEYDFNLPVTQNLVLTATPSKTYTVSFIADGVLIKQITYSYYNKSPDEPKIPDKQGHTAKWETYNLTGGDITVNAIYSPVIYFVRYYYGGALVHECKCAYGEISDNAPPVKEERGYTAEWKYEYSGGECTAQLKYIPIKYTVNFVIDGKIAKTQTATIIDEGSDWQLPEIPERSHYASKWEKVKVEGTTVEYSPVYTPIKYLVQFFDGENKIYEYDYDVENNVIDEPPAPVREHYLCKWESYALDGGDKKVNLEVTPKIYSISFYANDALVDVVCYTVEDESVTPPPVPEVIGAYGRWENYIPDGKDMTVNAIYTYVEGTAGLLYRKNEEGYTLYSYVGNESIVCVPPYYNGEKITKIAEEAFNPNVQNYKCGLEEVYIYDNVHTIEKNAFLSCDKLRIVRFSDGLKEIGDAAFMGCSALESVILPSGVEIIGDSAFSSCSALKTLKLSEKLKDIRLYAFQSCESLKEVIIPDSVERIATYAFVNCTALERIIFGKGLRRIDKNAFYNVTALTYAEFKNPNGWTFKSNVAEKDFSAIFSSSEKAAEALMTYQWNEDVYYEKADGVSPSAR